MEHLFYKEKKVLSKMTILKGTNYTSKKTILDFMEVYFKKAHYRL